MRHLSWGSVRLAAVLACAVSTLLLAQSPAAVPRAAAPTAASTTRAAQVLAATRAAITGDAQASIRTLVATGQTKRVRGDNLVPIEFEILIERPDRYVRKDEVPAEESAPTSAGFAGDDLIQIPPAPVAQAPARLVAVKQEFARLALGLWADSTSAYPLTFAYAAQAAAPQGNADVLTVTGDGGFSARLFVDSRTHLPLLLTWLAPPPGARGNPSPVENRLYYSDYRDVDGVKLPFRLRRAIGADTTEETTFDRFRVNTRIDPKKFGAK